MTWPMLSNGLFEVGQLSAVSATEPTPLTNAAMVRAEILNHAREPVDDAKAISSPTTLVSG